jgi:hypothetical protein
VSNRHTFGLIFKLDMLSKAYIAARRDNVVEMVVRSCASSCAALDAVPSSR